MNINFNLNGKLTHLDVDPNMPLLWAIRDILKLKATKFGCGIGQCGACSVHLDGKVQRSCILPIKLVQDKSITTLEGLSNESTKELHPVQLAWIEKQVPQCGYCQSGFMMSAASLLNEYPNPSTQQIKETITNLCRCGTHFRIMQAIQRASEIYQNKQNPKQ